MIAAPHANREGVTVVVAVRAHEGNPWVLPRLERLAHAYRGPYSVIIVDSGSELPWSAALATTCAKYGFLYTRDEDVGLFSPARARNIGIALIETRYGLLCDIDCLGETDLLERLVGHARATEASAGRCPVLSLPVYHLTQDQTEIVEQAEPSPSADQLMRRYALDLTYRRSGGHDGGFVAPYSNIVFGDRHTLHATGGYSEAFRGHGSEDFEFLVRAAIIDGFFPLPDRMIEDVDGPLEALGTHKVYQGFRRLLELSSFHAEAAGLRVCHLWHPRPEEAAWHAGGDKGKIRFAEIVSGYAFQPERLAEVDHIQRSANALLVTSDPVGAWRTAVFQRAQGWRVSIMDGVSVDLIADRLASADCQTVLFVEGDFLADALMADSRTSALLGSRNIKVAWLKAAPDPAESEEGRFAFDWNSYAVRRCGIIPPAPDHEPDPEQVATAFFRLGDYHSAAQHFQRAATKGRAVRNLRAAAEAWVACGDKAAALAALQEAAALAPGLKNIRRRMRSVRRPMLGAVLGGRKFSV